MHDIETHLFDEPSGDVRGFVVASITLRGKRKQLAHATILVGKAPSISVKVPSSPTLDEIGHITAALTAFTDSVATADAS